MKESRLLNHMGSTLFMTRLLMTFHAHRWHCAQDVTKAAKLAFFMYPNAVNTNGRYDQLAPDNFRYAITAKEIAAG
jgi:hypothetical protein